jgi:hypothetical protein
MRARLSVVCGAAAVASAIVAGAAYVVLLPRATTWALERRMTNCPTPVATCAPPGIFVHKRKLATPEDRIVVNPDADTLYSSAWLDLRDGPWVLHVPDMGARYFSFQLLDAWTEVFGTVARRTGDGQGGDYLIAGPNWNGLTPANVKKVFRAGTDDVWVFGRTLADGDADVARVTALQDQFGLRKFAGK